MAVQQKQDSIKETQIEFDNDVQIGDVNEQTSWWKTVAWWLFGVAIAVSAVFALGRYGHIGA